MTTVANSAATAVARRLTGAPLLRATRPPSPRRRGHQ
jgi:hypothetical protein